MSDLLAARFQMGMSPAFHIIFTVVGIAMPVMMVLAERRWRNSGVSLVLWGWAWSQYPYVVAPDLTIESAAAPLATLRLVIVVLVLGALVLVPSLFYLFRVFKSSDQHSAVSHP